MRLVIVGAGITGLACAYEARRQSPDAEIVVLDASPRPGGKLQTTPFADLLLDEAADAFLARVPDAVELCDELGLTPELTSPAARNAFIWSHGALRPLPTEQLLGVPTDLDALAATGIVSTAGIERARADLTSEAAAPVGDVSIGTVIRERLGDEVCERLVEPLVGGINAGRIDHLSLRASAAQIAAAADAGGSLVRAAAAIRSRATTDPNAPVFHAPVGGMGVLVDALVDAAAADIRTSTEVAALRRSGGGWTLSTTTGEVQADAVVVTAPAHVSADLLRPLSPDAADVLASIGFADVALTALAYDPAQVGHALDGSGMLVPVPEERFVTACSFASSKWAHLARPSQVVLRASAGRFGDDVAVTDLGDDDIVRRTRADLDEFLSIDGAPTAVRVSRWPRSFPQYRPGHRDLVDEVDAHLDRAAPGLVLAGASLRGIGVPACIRQGRDAARLLLG